MATRAKKVNVKVIEMLVEKDGRNNAMISRDCGYSDGMLSQVIHSGKASAPVIMALCKEFNVKPETITVASDKLEDEPKKVENKPDTTELLNAINSMEFQVRKQTEMLVDVCNVLTNIAEQLK